MDREIILKQNCEIDITSISMYYIPTTSSLESNDIGHQHESNSYNQTNVIQNQLLPNLMNLII